MPLDEQVSRNATCDIIDWKARGSLPRLSDVLLLPLLVHPFTKLRRHLEQMKWSVLLPSYALHERMQQRFEILGLTAPNYLLHLKSVMILGTTASNRKRALPHLTGGRCAQTD